MIPNWFFGYDVFLEVLFGIITFFVAAYALKLYRLTQEREFALLGTSFSLISLSYFVWSVINLLFVKELNESVRVLILPEINIFSVFWLYLHIMLFMVGLVTLFYMTARINSPRVYSLLIVNSLLVVLLSYNKSLAIHLISSIILGFVAAYYGMAYARKKDIPIRNTFIAFSLFFIANCLLMFAGNSYSQYVLAHMVELVAFGVILFNLFSILKNGGQKKKSPRNNS